MTYLLTLLIGGLLAWPYYHRFKSFGKDWNPLPLAALHAAPIAFGFVAILAYLNREGSLNHIFAFDLITGVTFWIIAIAFTIWNAYLIFTAESFITPDDFEIAIVVFIIICAVTFLMSTPAAYLVVTVVRSFS